MGLNLIYHPGQTPIDEDEKQGLKIRSISTQQELDEFEQFNIEKAVEWTISVQLKPEKILTEQFIMNLHKRMFGEVWKWAGKFRKSEKNLGINWIYIPLELRYLLDDVTFWIENKTYAPEEIVMRFKHRLVSIHCFPNGNGRHSRLMADVLMKSVFNRDVFNWNQSTLVKNNEVRSNYIKALKEADGGNINPLIEFAKS